MRFHERLDAAALIAAVDHPLLAASDLACYALLGDVVSEPVQNVEDGIAEAVDASYETMQKNSVLNVLLHFYKKKHTCC